MRFATWMMAGMATAALLAGGKAKAGATADNVKSKGFVQCGVNVSGLKRYPPFIVENFNPQAYGEPYDATKLELYQRRLLETGYFSAVHFAVEPDASKASAAPLNIAVIEAPVHALDTGILYSTDVGPGLKVDYSHVDVLHRAQTHHDLPAFDLVICDEAHRTTGAKFDDEDESYFIKVHDSAFIRGKKRLYMTATPRIYGDTAKATAERENVALCSMDDKAMYGENLYVLTFSEAVKRGLLVDYKVIVLSVEEAHVSRRIQEGLSLIGVSLNEGDWG